MKGQTDLSVALLLEDIRDAQKISGIFKKIGVHPYYYGTLKEFWNGVLETAPSLAIIDVKKMTERGLLLKNHSLIVEEKLPIAFFYSNESKPLLYSTYELFHLGLIEKDKGVQGQVKNILKRFNKFNSVLNEGKVLQEKCTSLDSKVVTAIESLQTYRENEFYKLKLDQIIENIEQMKGLDNFDDILLSAFDNWQEVKAFTIFELNGSSQKLLSPELEGKKFKKLPSLWLGKACAAGIDSHVQSMANQVVFDLIGGDLMVLVVAKKLIFLQIKDEDFLNLFDWNSFERYLVGLEALVSAKDTAKIQGDKLFMNGWELLSEIDSHFFSIDSLADQNEETLIDINLNPLMDLIKTSGKNRFYWKRFFRDFSYKISSVVSSSFKMSPMSIDHIALLVDKENANQVFSQIKMVTARFSYWRYFEDNDVLLTKEVKPIVRMVPVSSDAYLNYIKKGAVQLVSQPFLAEKSIESQVDLLSQLKELEAPLEMR